MVKLMQRFVSRSRVVVFRMNAPDSPNCTLNSCFGVFCSVWVHLGPFHYCMKLSAKRAELVQLLQKFMPRSHVGIFHEDCTIPTTLDPKLMFWCVSQCLGAFGIVSLFHETWCKTGWTCAINAIVCAKKSCCNFSQRTHLIHPIRPLTHVFVHFVVFGYIWDHFITLWNLVQNGLNWCN
jgi:uncharacterized protein (DUF1499 family)